MKKTINRIFTVVFLATIFLVFGMSARTLPPDSNKQFWKGETELSFLADINYKSFVNETNSNLSPAATFTVNLTSDEEDFNVGDGICDANSAVAGNQCTLRAAIQEANATTDPDNINFLIPISGLQVIQLAASLPAITSPVVINGYTQPGSSPNTLAVGNNAVFRIRINSNGHNALNVTAGNSTIRGLLFTVAESVAVSLQTNGNNLVEGCWFGLFADGTAFSSPNSINIWVLSNNNVIGGAAPQSRNVISNSTNQGIILAGNNNTVQNNYIGTDPSGTQPRSNNNDGIFIQGSDNLIGGTNGITAGNCTGECNRIAFNSKGVVLESGNTGMLLTNNRILGNSIYSNSSLGIDLDDDGVTQNDLNDTDIGANNAQNFPVILSATNGGGTKVQGTFNSTANRTFRLEFFNSAENDASGYGEGQFFIGSTDVETDANGNASFDQTFAYNSPTGSYVSATATDLTTGDTSEFAQSKQVSCGYSLSPTFLNIAAVGGNGNINVSGGDGCGWTAVSNDEWITITGGGSGTGNGAVAFTVAANTGEARTGTITVAGQTFTVNQASGCAFSISPTSANITSEGDSGSFTLTASNSGCAWSAVSSDEWITITSDASGTGDTTVEFKVDASDVPARSGTITIGGLTFTINQAGGCAFSISPTSANVPAGSGTADFEVNSGEGCEWTAVSNDDWINITEGGSGAGDGTVTYAFEANTGAARTGTITVNDKTFTVNQASGCTYSLSPTNANFTAEGGTDDFDVTAVEGCAWTATTDDDWITINSGGTGDGNGTVSFSVEANTGAARTGTITVNGQTFTVTQASGCTFSLLPTSMTIGAASGNGNVNVTSGSGCEWTAVSNAEWITVTSGAEGTGNGTVQFTAAASDVPERTGTITIGGQTFTVKQVSSCT
ncbi:MAG TPA: BACON domain-containing carbohydrate-binding protein, partial [Pyrinomonadaceae bacterium]|nr:BACON domain-containing carbohydrate-binding protein [Pyrinomonadaceae bacterium]